ncbi:Hypothetical protein CINCED_3A013491 [Cinara cedri]|uniref:Uncharacterized protein n=1 Tax=Cinara cedri TaxID=506608 RepID=A0A5E4M453_9HEMI|nr:Hypothetical protein CINCED_3A013491 [Cinara cedri]
MHDLKHHLHLPFQGANFGFRFMEGYSGLPAHLLHHLQPQFLHPALDPRISFSPAGVFQPLGSPNPHHPQHQHHAAAAVAAAGLKGFTSAFAPPSKCYKMDDKSAAHAEASSFPYPPRRSPCSPASMSMSPPSSAAAAAAAVAANMHQHAKDECSDRDTPSSGAVSEDGRLIRITVAFMPGMWAGHSYRNRCAARNANSHAAGPLFWSCTPAAAFLCGRAGADGNLDGGSAVASRAEVRPAAEDDSVRQR